MRPETLVAGIAQQHCHEPVHLPICGLGHLYAMATTFATKLTMCMAMHGLHNSVHELVITY